MRNHGYRKHVKARGLHSCRVIIKETDLLINSSTDLHREATDRVHHYRNQLEEYIEQNPDFLSSLLPYPDDPLAPEIIRDMISVTRIFGVGPMAAVAGTIAQLVGRDLLNYADEVIVENGGDIFAKTLRPITVSIFAGSSPLSQKVGLIVKPFDRPAGICTSSGSIGHSLSLGIADAVCIVAESASVADAAATSLGNKISGKKNLASIIESFKTSRELKGGIVIAGKTMATWGEINLTATS